MQFCLETKIMFTDLLCLAPFRSCRPRIDFLSLCLMCQKSVFLNEWRSPNRLPPARVAKKKSKILSKILELCDMKYFIFLATLFAIFCKKNTKKKHFCVKRWVASPLPTTLLENIYWKQNTHFLDNYWGIIAFNNFYWHINDGSYSLLLPSIKV